MNVARGWGVPSSTLGIVGMPSEECQGRLPSAAMRVRRNLARSARGGHRHAGVHLGLRPQFPSHGPLPAVVAGQENRTGFAADLVVVTSGEVAADQVPHVEPAIVLAYR